MPKQTKCKRRRRIALVDADVLVYTAAWAAEEGVEWEDGVHTLHVNNSVVEEIVTMILAQTIHATGADAHILVLSDPKRVFRQDIFEAYKANRRGQRKPLAWASVRRYMEHERGAIWRPNLEADDVLGILSTGNTKLAPSRADKIICSVDKDLRQIPGLHFNWKKEEDGVEFVGEDEADFFFWCQTLAGDATDGIPGIPGIGLKKAEKILEAAGRPPRWSTVVDTYEKHNLGAEYALTMARLVRILRADDYNFKRRKVRLWTPAEETA